MTHDTNDDENTDATQNPGDRVDDTIQKLARTAFPRPAAPREAMWAAIEQRRQEAAQSAPLPLPQSPPTLVVHRTSYRRRYLSVAAGMAATLIVGVGIGRLSRGTVPAATTVASATADDASYSTPDTPRRLTMDTHLARTEVLLTTLRSSRDRNESAAELANAAQALLGTTRQLLDDPALTDGTTRALLLDLELVLAQVVQDAATRQPDARRASRDAVIRMNLLPRLRASGSTAEEPALSEPSRSSSE